MSTSKAVEPNIREEQIPDWMFEFKLHGFIMLRNFLPVDLIDAMNRQFQTFVALEIEADRQGSALSGRGTNRYAISVGNIVEKIGGPLNDPRARRNPIIEGIVTRILGTWRHSKTIVECPCKDSDYMTWHGDQVREQRGDPGEAKRTRLLKFQIPLIDVSEEHGPIEVIPGSHRMYYNEGSEAVEQLPETHAVKLLMRRGDCFLRDGELIHRGTPNRTDTPRPLYSQTYKII